MHIFLMAGILPTAVKMHCMNEERSGRGFKYDNLGRNYMIFKMPRFHLLLLG